MVGFLGIVALLIFWAIVEIFFGAGVSDDPYEAPDGDDLPER